MNYSMTQDQPEGQISSEALKSPVTEQTETISDTTSQGSTNKKNVRVNEYTPDSLWSNVRYGLGMLLATVAPLLIPGVSYRELIVGLMATSIVIYILICTLAIARGLRLLRTSKSGHRRKY